MTRHDTRGDLPFRAYAGPPVRALLAALAALVLPCGSAGRLLRRLGLGLGRCCCGGERLSFSPAAAAAAAARRLVVVVGPSVRPPAPVDGLAAAALLLV